jgi:hypothetical protein
LPERGILRELDARETLERNSVFLSEASILFPRPRRR